MLNNQRLNNRFGGSLNLTFSKLDLFTNSTCSHTVHPDIGKLEFLKFSNVQSDVMWVKSRLD